MLHGVQHSQNRKRLSSDLAEIFGILTNVEKKFNSD